MQLIKTQNGGFSLPKDPRILGIIAEYNPFHWGHAWQIKEAKKVLNPDLTVIILGGNYTQRGEMAVIRREDKVRLALDYGADLVVGIPFYSNIQAVREFALGSVKIAKKIGVTNLAFGTELPNFAYQKKAHLYLTNNSEILPQINKPNANYANNLAPSFAKLGISLKQSNHLLGFYYALAIEELAAKISLLPMPRRNNPSISSHRIRELLSLKREADLASLVPPETISSLVFDSVNKFESTFALVKAKLILGNYAKFAPIFLFNEELFYRCQAAIKKCNNYQDFIHQVKTKRYTLTHIKRIYLYLLLEIQQQQVQDSDLVEIWGFNRKGQVYLSSVKKKVKFLTNLQKAVYQQNAVLRDEYRYNQFYDYIMETSASRVVIKR